MAGLRANLGQVELTGGFTGHGYHLRILADRTGRPVQAPVGLRAQLAWPTPTAGRVDADKLTRKIEGKASKYRALAAELGVPLAVAEGAEPFTGVTLADFDNLLAGSNTLVLQFNPQNLALKLDAGEVSLHREGWTMPMALAGVLWLDRDLPFTATIRPNPAVDQAPEVIDGLAAHSMREGKYGSPAVNATRPLPYCGFHTAD